MTVALYSMYRAAQYWGKKLIFSSFFFFATNSMIMFLNKIIKYLKRSFKVQVFENYIFIIFV